MEGSQGLINLNPSNFQGTILITKMELYNILTISGRDWVYDCFWFTVGAYKFWMSSSSEQWTHSTDNPNMDGGT